MTITVGRLLAYLLAITVATVALVFAWSRLEGNRSSFPQQAKAICRQEEPAIADAPDFQTALSRAREMRLRLSVLTAPAPQQALFSDWLAKLQASENAALRGDWPTAQTDDAAVQVDVRGLGLADGCTYHLH